MNFEGRRLKLFKFRKFSLLSTRISNIYVLRFDSKTLKFSLVSSVVYFTKRPNVPRIHTIVDKSLNIVALNCT